MAATGRPYTSTKKVTNHHIFKGRGGEIYTKWQINTLIICWIQHCMTALPSRLKHFETAVTPQPCSIVLQ